MTFRITDALANAALDLVADAADAGPGAGTVQVRTGAQPAGPGSAATGTLLVTITLNDPAFGSAAARALAAIVSPVPSGTAVAGGVAGWARVLDSTGAAVSDGSVGASGSGEDFIIGPSTTIASGQIVTLDSGSITL